MTALLERLQAFAAIDRHFAAMLARLVPGTPDEVLLAAALASWAVQQGHVCLDLTQLGASSLRDQDGQPVALPLPDQDQLRALLGQSPLVGDGCTSTPLVLDQAGRLYLKRYWDYEQTVAREVRARCALMPELDAPALRQGLGRLFPARAGVPDEQRQAAAVAVLRRLCVITGGPGTGKTSTVVKVLALLQEQARALRQPWLRVALLAPTGKAAQRLGEAIEQQRAGLACDDDVKGRIPGSGATLHRALGFQPRTPTRFRHGRDDPLPADVVLVDEASMVPLALMAKLLAAVPPHARLILLGDKDQLASVDAGAVLGDLCAGAGGVSAGFADAARSLAGVELPVGPDRPEPGLHDAIALLTRSWRYPEGSGIGQLARAVHGGDADAAVAVLRSGTGDVDLVALERDDLTAALRARCIEGMQGLGTGSPEQRLAAQASFRVLCAHRHGAHGAEALNGMIERWLAEAGMVRIDTEWYDGRPVLVTRNDAQVELWNGDAGVAMAGKVWFQGQCGPRAVPPALLPPHGSMYAMTVHKSQGSEAERVVLVLPEQPSPVLTRELIYTAVTRARRGVVVLGSEAVLREAIARRTVRASGLREALWAREKIY